MRLSRKAINFDLSTNELNKHFKDTREPYNLIKDFMLENGFEHRQYSGYMSKEAMDEFDIELLIKRMSKQYSWLYSCVQRFDVTDIGEQYDLTHLFTCESQRKQEPDITANRTKDSTKHYTPKELEILEKSKQAIKKMKATDSHSKDKGSER